jgi:hypothetical protein
MNAKGYGGGIFSKTQGGSPTGPGIVSRTANGGGAGGTTAWSEYAAGASYGSLGVDAGGYATRGSTYGANDFVTELYLGSGGGYATIATGGAGGGAIKISTPTLTLASGAQIMAKGGAPTVSNLQYAGGGSGGTIVLDVLSSFTNSGGTISVEGGGSGVTNFVGGYGRLSIDKDRLIDGSSDINLTGIKGLDLHLEATDAVNTLTIGAGSLIRFTADAGATVNTLTINGAAAEFFLNQNFSFSTVNVTLGTLTSNAYDNFYSGGTWTNAPAAGNGRLMFTASTAVTVGAGGVIHMNAKGYGGGIFSKTQGGSPTGPGIVSRTANGGGAGGTTAWSEYAAGASYATFGVASPHSKRGSLYGANDFATELYLGSGGGYATIATGGAGGGAIKISTPSLTLASGAQIMAKGSAPTVANPAYGGAGSGGTVALDISGSFSNNGTISVEGGNTSTAYIGGRGRVSIAYQTCPTGTCPHLGNAAPPNYVPGFSSTVQCKLDSGTYTCHSDTLSVYPPEVITKINPVSSPDTLRTPTIRVSGGRSFKPGSSVVIFSDACNTAIGSKQIEIGDTYLDITSNPLADGSYLIYAAIVGFNGLYSACSLVSVPYSVDNTDASVPVLSILTPSSPSSSQTPTFRVVKDGGGNFILDEQVSFYLGSNCSGGAIGSAADLLAASLYDKTLSSGVLIEGTNILSSKITASNNNTQCSNNVTYVLDTIAPTWSVGPVISNADKPFASTSQTPSITYSSNAQDTNGSGVSHYQYAIGTTSSNDSVVPWTTVGASPFSHSGLSLTNGNRYYVNMRAVDFAGNVSVIYSDSWIVDTSAVSETLSVTKKYPTNGSKLMDYVATGTDVACNAATATAYSHCEHGGLKLKVEVPGEADCTNLEAHDDLDAFSWVCDDSGTTTFYSTGLKDGKSLRTLIDFPSKVFLDNFITVTGGSGTSTTYTSTPSKWWTNLIKDLPNNSTGSYLKLDGVDDDTTGPDLVFSAGDILVLNSSRDTGGYSLYLDKIAIVLNEGVTLTFNGISGTALGCSARVIVCNYQKNFNWVEGKFHGSSYATKATTGVFLHTGSFNGHGPIELESFTQYGLYLYNASYNNFMDVTANNSGINGLWLRYFSQDNRFGDVTANNSKSSGANSGGIVIQQEGHKNEFGNVEASNNLGSGVVFTSTANNLMKMGNVDANDNGRYGLDLEADNHQFGNVTALDNGLTGLRIYNVEDSTFGDVTVTGNGENGLHVYLSPDNSFGNVIANSNLGAVWYHSGILIQQSSDNLTFGDIQVYDNAGNGLYFYSTVFNNVTMGAIEANENTFYGLSLEGDDHQFGNISANDNGLSGVRVYNVENSSFGDISTSSNGENGLYLYLSPNNTFGNVIANDNHGTQYYHSGITLQQSCDNNTFGDIEVNNNIGNGLYFFSTVFHNIQMGNINANNNSIYGVALLGNSHQLGNITTNSNGSDGFFISGSSNLIVGNLTSNLNGGNGMHVVYNSSNNSFGDVVANGNLAAAGGGVTFPGYVYSNYKFNSIVANNNTHAGFFVVGTMNNLEVKDYLIANHNYYGIFLANGSSKNQVINNITAISNADYGIYTTSSFSIFNNILSVNNGKEGLYLSTATDNTINNFFSNNNGSSGVLAYFNSTNNYFTGVLNSSGNTGLNCALISTAATSGVVNSTCTTTGVAGSSSYPVGALSDAVYRTKTATSSFVTAVKAPGDDTNSDDGELGTGTGTVYFSFDLDLFNFDNVMRTIGKASTSLDSLDQTQRGYCLAEGEGCRIWDYSLRKEDMSILNKSGNGEDYNDGGSAPALGVNSYEGGLQTCPAEVLGNRNVTTKGHPFDANFQNGAIGYAFAGPSSSTKCTSGTCYVRYLRNATEIIEDSIGDDDGLCEDNESCYYNPNIGAYQGHFTGNEANPVINHDDHECTWSANGGLMTGIRMYGFPKNGR